ncbi:NAD(P)H-hydrate dehydratase [Mucilaginibacter corticis]|uniref:Bifunctional NAD(P)H-hydrate repair enzyme n=1 Tax=Mucilaginibacter corticis TaxID=2597670 RepID=A0A556MV37_9SPHI|nr:NAD(P)H-hydrate dehydratase [Mucilaginibacter corticis]TSJ43811.1 NAD(P)H-hydrate dehydratase [Mucilaginibacter corticis]
MLPLLIAPQIREADAHTIANVHISSVDLMERASKAFVGWFINHFPDKKTVIAVYCGTGNNGGDGLAIARMLHDHKYLNVAVKLARYSEKSTDDFNINLRRLNEKDIGLIELKPDMELPAENSQIIIDALLGSGLNNPLAGDYKKLAEYINSLNKTVVAVDVPTGFFTDGEMDKDATVIRADLVITFQQPKINFLLPESAPHINCWEAVNIGLDEAFIRSLKSPYLFVEEKDVKKMLKPRHHFSNKGTYGHALLIAGQAKTMGAALLSSAGCAYAGAGLTTACVPESGLIALNTYLPELMAVVRKADELPDIDWKQYTAIGIGPGLGKDTTSLALLNDVLDNSNKPIVVDADALNLLGENPELLNRFPAGSILTPHMKEFDRLFGKHDNWWQRLQSSREAAKKHNIYIVLKNDYTIVATPDEKVYFNSTSNAAMATGGMGDVLTGIITSLLAQKYTPEEACVLGVYIHGKAGDELALPNRLNVVLPGRLAQQLPVTMAKLMA